MGDLLLVTGDNSADQYAANIVTRLREADYDGRIFAAAGEHTEAAGAELVENLVDHAVVGFVEVVTSLPYFFSLASKLENLVQEEDIEAVLFLDFPGFNLRLARRLRKYDVELFYYIPPQVWAWGESRVDKLKDWFTELFVIFPFEVDFYRQHGGEAEFVGHPRFQAWQNKKASSVKDKLNVGSEKFLVSFFPGSRSGEIDRHLDVMAAVAEKVRANFPAWEPVFSVASSVEDSQFERLSDDFKLWRKDSYSLLTRSEFTVLTSGTVTMEAAFTRTPMVACYRTSWLSYLFATWLVGDKNIAMPNYLSETKPVPELIQGEFGAENLFKQIERFLSDRSEREKQVQELETIAAQFTGKDPVGQVTQSLVDYLEPEAQS